MAARHGSLLMRTLQPPPPATAAAAITSPLLLLFSPSFGALEMPESLLSLFSYFLTIRTTKWKYKSISMWEEGEGWKHQEKAWRKLSDRTELKSTQGNLEIYIQSPPLWKSKLHSWHPIFLADMPCKIDQYKLVTSRRQERRDRAAGESMHNNQCEPCRDSYCLLLFFKCCTILNSKTL